MQSTTPSKRGDVVLVPFPFTEGEGAKRRPALVVSDDSYNASCPDVIIAQITSRLNAPPRPGDYRIRGWREAGLLVPSLARVRLATLRGSLIRKRLGAMTVADMDAFNGALLAALGLTRA